MSNLMKYGKGLKSGHQQYRSIKGKIEKVEGKIKDIRKLQTFASNLIHQRAGSSSVLLELSYEGITRLAGLLPTPYVSNYLQFYQSGISAVSQLWRAKDESKLVLDWSRGLHKSATEFEDAIDALVAEYSYAGAMVNCDGYPSGNLPSGLQDYLRRLDEYEASLQDVNNSIKTVNWMKVKQARETVSFILNMRLAKKRKFSSASKR